MRPAERVALIALIVWTVLTAPLGFMFVSADWSDSYTPDLRYVGPVLLGAWLAGSAVILGIAAWRGPRASGQGESEHCPQCGSAVSAGSPTCLNCGYNLMRSR